MSAQNDASNWLGLLKWSLSYADGTTPSQFSAMSEEDKKWLENVMKEGVRDDPQRMNEVMTKLKDGMDNNGSFEDTEGDLEDLRDIVEQVDMAQVFAKFGGCDLLLRFIETTQVVDSVKALAAAIMATVAQNNLIVQEQFLRKGFLDKLIKAFLHFPASELLSTKLFFALSSAVRGHPSAEEYFAIQCSELVFNKALQSNYPATLSRAAFLANALICSDFCTVDRIETISRVFLPISFQFCCFPDEQLTSLRFNLIQLFETLLQTRLGHQLMNQSFSKEFQSFLVQQGKWLNEESVVELFDKEEIKEEKSKLEKLRRLAATDLKEESFPSQQARANQSINNFNSSSSNSKNNSYTQQQQQEPGQEEQSSTTSSSSLPLPPAPVLLLGSPPDKESSC
jgi:hypothetical protein